MLEKLTNLLKNAYAPYSKFPVSSIIIMKDGKEISGVNIENASYGATICAERNAITTAITNGYQKGDFKEIHILTNSDKVSVCCFICRQLITEFFEKNDDIYCYSLKGEVKHYKVDDLCPKPFDKEHLL